MIIRRTNNVLLSHSKIAFAAFCSFVKTLGSLREILHSQRLFLYKKSSKSTQENSNFSWLRQQKNSMPTTVLFKECSKSNCKQQDNCDIVSRSKIYVTTKLRRAVQESILYEATTALALVNGKQKFPVSLIKHDRRRIFYPLLVENWLEARPRKQRASFSSPS